MKLLGKAQDPSFWTEEVAKGDHFEKFRKECINYWEKNDLENFDFKALKYSDYKLFWETGDRKIFEHAYFTRRAAIEHTLPLALMYPEKKIYVDKIMDWAFAILDEYSWCLPAHQGTLGPNDNSRVDLFASETGLNMALLYVLLGDRLDELIKNRILHEVDRRVVKTVLSVDNYGWWEVGHSNWTAVCTGAVACTIMLLYPELMDEALIKRFNTSIDGYLAGFKDDGICLEGCGYWAYGMTFFVQYADMIRTFTGGKVDYFKLPKMKAIATFPQKMFLTGNASVSFADGGRTLAYTVGVMHRLKSEYPDDVLIYDPKYGAYGMGCGRACVWISGAAWTVEEYWRNPAEATAFESYAADSQWYVNRTGKYGFAAKAGNNNELHNHNDVGSFIFAKNGRQMICDLGSGLYTRQYFSSERYTILECASFGHGVPLIGGEAQSVGADYKASDVEWREGEFSFDMAGAYKVEGLKSLRRSFVCAQDSVKLTDTYEYEGEGELVERFVSLEEPSLKEAGVLLIDEAELRFDPDVCTIKVTHTSGTSGGNKDVYLIDFALNQGVRSFSCEIA